MKKTIFVTVLIMIMFMGSIAYADELTYSDVKETDWFYSYVKNAIKVGAADGYPDGTYQPNRAVTKGEFIKIIVVAVVDKTVGVNITEGKHWAYDYFVVLNNKYLLPNTVTMENLDEQITREEMAYILSKIVFNVLDEQVESTAGVQNLIKDYDTIGTSYQSHVMDTYARGLIGGDDNGNFSPKKSMTRAETATVLTRVLFKEQRIKVETGVTEVDLGKVTYDLTDPNRGPAKEGDIVIGTDGKLYEVKVDEKIKKELGVEILGVGIPAALDLGKADALKKDGTPITYVTDGKSCADPKSEFWGQRYTVFNGEGHYKLQWRAIIGVYMPKTSGTQDGEIDSSGYFKWNGSSKFWELRFSI